MNIGTPSNNFIQLPFMKRRDTPSEPGKKELRLPFVGFLPNKVRNHFIAMVGEFCGTFLFLFFAFAGTQVANAAANANNAATAGTSDGSLSKAPNANVLLYISLCFGFSLAVNVWVFFRISGGLFNPAVTLGLAMIGAIGWVRAGLVFIAEILGAMASAGVVSALFPGPLNVATTLSGDTSVARGLFIEMFLTAELVFAIFMLAAEKHKGTFLAPIGIGLALFVSELAGVYFTGGSLNPARSFGPQVVLGHFPGYHWIYWLGPALGALIAVGFYRFVKVLEYETANPGQDFNEKEAEVFTFDEENAATGQDVSRPTVAIGAPDYVSDARGTRASDGSISGSRAGVTTRNSNLSSRGGVQSQDSNQVAGSGGRVKSRDGNQVPAAAAAGRLDGARSESTNAVPMHPGFTGDDTYHHGPHAEDGNLYADYRGTEQGDLGGNIRPSS